MFLAITPIISLLLIYWGTAIPIAIALVGTYILFISATPVFIAIKLSAIVSNIMKMPKICNNIVVILVVTLGIWCLKFIPNATIWIFGIVAFWGIGIFFAGLLPSNEVVAPAREKRRKH